MASQKDIAEALNISVATVSRALRGDPSHNAETTARVLEEATRQGYRLRPTSARRAREAESAFKMFGAMVIAGDREGKSSSLVTTRILRGMSDAAREWNVGLSLHYSLFAERALAHLPEQLPPALREGRLDGLLLVGEYPAETVRAFVRMVPCIHVDFHESNVLQDYVGQDHYRSVEKLMDHLYERGHRRIGFVGSGIHSTYARARYGAYVEMLAMLGIRYNPDWVRNVYDVQLPAKSFAAILNATRKGVTAWVCLHDRLGYELAEYLIENGLRIPKDVSLGGFDDLPPPQGLPKLTSMDSPFEEIGGAAVARLLERIQKPSALPVSITYSGRLVEGKSVGPPAAPGQKRRTVQARTLAK